MNELKSDIRNFSSNKPDKLVIFLHGFGADGRDLLDLSFEYKEIFPNAVFLSPNAPFPCEDFPFGYQWFSLRDRSDERLYNGMCEALPILERFIFANLKKYELSIKDLVLIGFSQGTMMSLGVALNLPETCLAVLGFSGILIGSSKLDKAKIKRPNIFLVHGDQDQVLPLNLHLKMVRELAELDIQAETHVIKGDAHGISSKALELSKKFLKSILNKI